MFNSNNWFNCWYLIIYQETLIPSIQLLKDLKTKFGKMGIVTGRPRKDANKFLTQFHLSEYFEVVVCMEDTAKPKPDPAPVSLALSKLGITKAILIGDTPDDLNASTLASMLLLLLLFFFPPVACS